MQGDQEYQMQGDHEFQMLCLTSIDVRVDFQWGLRVTLFDTSEYSIMNSDP